MTVTEGCLNVYAMCPHLNFSKWCPIFTKFYVDVRRLEATPISYFNCSLLFRKAVQIKNCKTLCSSGIESTDNILSFAVSSVAQNLQHKIHPEKLGGRVPYEDWSRTLHVLADSNQLSDGGTSQLFINIPAILRDKT
jgi:hypothetical protein